jgi:tryptophan synthase alpha chain
MKRMPQMFQRCRDDGSMALVAYLTAGYPDLGRSLEYLLAVDRAGADVIEIGVPFTDPVADGPIIQHTSDHAIRTGTRPTQVFELVRCLRAESETPIVLMGYYNPIFAMGEGTFVSRAAEAGVDGMIVADLPLEEATGMIRACRIKGLDMIQMVTRLTPPERMITIARESTGYLYLVSRTGTTGKMTQIKPELRQLIGHTKHLAGRLPVVVGFGLSEFMQMQDLRLAGADGAIVGSALLKRMIEGVPPEKVGNYVTKLKAACGSKHH